MHEFVWKRKERFPDEGLIHITAEGSIHKGLQLPLCGAQQHYAYYIIYTR